MSSKYCVLLFLLIAHIHLFGQKNCGYKIDTARILADKNLDGFLAALRTGPFQISKKKKDIPTAILQQLACMSPDKFTLADPDEDYQCCCTSSRKLPVRQLVAFGRSRDCFFIVFRRGGIGIWVSLLMLKLDNDKIVDLWEGIGSPNMQTADDIVKMLTLIRRNHEETHFNFVAI